MVYLNLAWMEWGTPTFAVGSIHCAHGSLTGDHFFPYVHRSVPVFVSAPEAFENN